MAMKVPLMVAHRGYAKRFPENTLESLEAALVVGACFVEFDVQLTSDGVAVLHHDDDLQRTAGVTNKVSETTFRQLSQVAVSQADIFGDRFTEVRVPTLASATALLSRWPRVRAFVEIKPDSVERFGTEPVLERVRADLAGAPSQSILISSVVDLVARARQLGQPSMGLVLREWSSAVRRQLEELQPDYALCNLKRIPGESDLWPGPWKWVVYEVVSPRLALELAGRGADLIETMAIGEMLADPVLGTRGCRD